MPNKRKTRTSGGRKEDRREHLESSNKSCKQKIQEKGNIEEDTMEEEQEMHTTEEERERESVTDKGVDWKKMAIMQHTSDKVSGTTESANLNTVVTHPETNTEMEKAVPPVVSTHEGLCNQYESSVGNASALMKNTVNILREKVVEQGREERRRVKEYVLLILFRKVKFLASDDMLDNCIRHMVEKGLGVVTAPTEVAWWWGEYRGLVKHAISEKRSNITADMRRRFEKGKS